MTALWKASWPYLSLPFPPLPTPSSADIFAAAGRSRESAFFFSFFLFRSASLTFTDWAPIEKAAHLDFVTSSMESDGGISELVNFFERRRKGDLNQVLNLCGNVRGSMLIIESNFNKKK